MLFYLFSAEAFQELFAHMDYSCDTDVIQRNIEYYMQRTSHGSTLSRIVHSWVLARSDRESSWKLFEKALRSDIEDIQGGTTSEGIHLGAMASTVDLIQRVYTGLEMRDDVLWLNPFLPSELSDIRLRIHYTARPAPPGAQTTTPGPRRGARGNVRGQATKRRGARKTPTARAANLPRGGASSHP